MLKQLGTHDLRIEFESHLVRVLQRDYVEKVRNPVFDNSVEISGTFGTFFVQGNQCPGCENSGCETPSQVDLGRGGEHLYLFFLRGLHTANMQSLRF